MTSTQKILVNAKEAVNVLRGISDEKINEALLKMADTLVLSTDKILKENERDVELARDKISPVMIDRLTLTEQRILSMAEGIRDIANLPSPLGL